ncbi:MAG: DedA family protein [Fimbriimonadaceae bacterium]|nr:DedA family protein [Fimbriimonadaceae bacterium]
MSFFGIALEDLVRQAGYVGLFCIVFAESGLFFGFFLPGDSLLMTAGLVASKGLLDPVLLTLLLSVAAVAGDNTGYWFGRWTGPKLFAREDSRFFKRQHLLAAQAFYERHGVKTVILARYMPFVRTFAPIVAGAAPMPYRKFFWWDLFGALLWVNTTTWVGWGVGTFFKNILTPEQLDHFFLGLVLLVIVLSVLPSWLHVRLEKRRHAAATAASPEAQSS